MWSIPDCAGAGSVVAALAGVPLPQLVAVAATAALAPTSEADVKNCRLVIATHTINPSEEIK
jgi:hypothetical protein